VLLPLARSAPVTEIQEGKLTVTPAVDDLLEEWVRGARLPRKWAERCRGLLWTQKTLSGERRRRGSLAGFRKHPLFPDGLALFELSVEATGEHSAELAAWREGGAPQVSADPAGLPARRRRRRRGRGRGPGPEGAEPPRPSSDAEETAPAGPLDIPAIERA
jgi:poly(A) polymerase